jgi:hypothetical protein
MEGGGGGGVLAGGEHSAPDTTPAVVLEEERKCTSSMAVHVADNTCTPSALGSSTALEKGSSL